MSAKTPSMSEFQLRQYDRLRKSLDLAAMFIDRGERAMDEMKERDTAKYPSVHMASAKRISMELTRALAQLRKSAYRE